MSFEDEKMSYALATLKATEKRCSSSSPTVGSGGGGSLVGRLSSSPSFSSLQSMKSRFQGLLLGPQQGGDAEETKKVSRSEDWAPNRKSGWSGRLLVHGTALGHVLVQPSGLRMTSEGKSEV